MKPKEDVLLNFPVEITLTRGNLQRDLQLVEPPMLVLAAWIRRNAKSIADAYTHDPHAFDRASSGNVTAIIDLLVSEAAVSELCRLVEIMDESHDDSAVQVSEVITLANLPQLVGTIARVLDVGALKANFTQLLQDLGLSVTAVEIDDEPETAPSDKLSTEPSIP